MLGLGLSPARLAQNILGTNSGNGAYKINLRIIQNSGIYT